MGASMLCPVPVCSAPRLHTWPSRGCRGTWLGVNTEAGRLAFLTNLRAVGGCCHRFTTCLFTALPLCPCALVPRAWLKPGCKLCHHLHMCAPFSALNALHLAFMPATCHLQKDPDPDQIAATRHTSRGALITAFLNSTVSPAEYVGVSEGVNVCE